MECLTDDDCATIRLVVVVISNIIIIKARYGLQIGSSKLIYITYVWPVTYHIIEARRGWTQEKRIWLKCEQFLVAFGFEGSASHVPSNHRAGHGQQGCWLPCWEHLPPPWSRPHCTRARNPQFRCKIEIVMRNAGPAAKTLKNNLSRNFGG